MRSIRVAAGVLLSAIALSAAPAAEVSFAEKPAVKRAGDGLEIRFALSRPSDVEVSIVDSKGKTVRHLAAGVIGRDAVAPPLRAGLAQTLKWDGKDDDGQAVGDGPHQVRVRAGMQVRFGRMIGGSPYTGSVVQMPYRAPVNGLAVDDEGRLIVKMMSNIGSHGNSGLWPWHVRLFDREGSYLKTLYPYPPSTPREKASGFALLEKEAGEFTPANQASLYPVFAELGNELVPRLVDGQLAFVHTEARQLHFLKLDGSNALSTRTMWPQGAKLNCPSWLDIQVAFSPDGRTAYYSNVAGVAYDGRTPADIDAKWPQGRIYRHDLTKEDSLPEKFFDLTLPDFDREKYWMPSAWDKKTAAAGIDCDAKGNVVVCDLVSGKVVEIDPAGKALSETKIDWPDKVLVNRRTGELYVVSRKVSRGGLPPATLTKIAGRGDNARVVARLELPGTVGGAITLDETGAAPVLWLAGRADDGKPDEELIRVVDEGDALTIAGDNFLNRDANAITFVGYMDVDREAELVYVTRSGGTAWRFNGENGEGGPLPIKAVDLAIGPKGHIYTWGIDGSYHGPIARYTRQLEPAPLEGTGSHTFGEVYGRAGRGSSVCGMDIDAQGCVFATYGTNECHVRGFGLDGKLIDFPRKIKHDTNRGPVDVPVAIDGVIGYGGSIRLDREGNIYLLQQGLPKDFTPPAGYEKDEAYRAAVGTIYKFSPKGGAIKTADWAVKEVDGAIAAYPDCGPISRWRAAGACACTKPRFDVDDFGRLYIPNGITFSVRVCDNAGNEIVRFGGYGNYDCQGPNSREPEPAIPLGWPVTAGASDRFIYVGDCLNHRVVRVDKTFAVEAVAAVAAK